MSMNWVIILHCTAKLPQTKQHVTSIQPANFSLDLDPCANHAIEADTKEEPQLQPALLAG